MKRIRQFSDAHPLISAFAGIVALIVFALAMLPPDSPYLDQPHHSKGAA